MKFLNKFIEFISKISFIFALSESFISMGSFLNSTFLVFIYISILKDSLKLNLNKIFMYLFSSSFDILSFDELFIIKL